MPRALPVLMLSALIVIALGLRLWGIAFGLPARYHADEPAHVDPALGLLRLKPGTLSFGNPPLYRYLLAAEYSVDYALGRLSGRYAGGADFAAQFRADPSALTLQGRITSALLGALTLLPAYALAAALRGHAAGLLAAALAGVNFLLVRESHFAVNDALVTLLAGASLVASVRLLRDGRGRDALAAGALAGLAFAAKYQGAIALIPLGLAAALRPPGGRLRTLLLGLAAAVLAALVAFPSLVLESGRVWRDVYQFLYLRGLSGYDGLDPAGGHAYYLKVFAWALGWPGLLGAAAGIVAGLVRRERAIVVVSSLPIVLYAYMGTQRMFFARFILPALPALCVLAAVAAIDLLAALADRARLGAPARLARATGVMVLLTGPPLVDAVRLDRLLASEDTRTLAVRWFEANVPAQAAVAIDWGTFVPPLPAERYRLLVANGWTLHDRPLAQYRDEGIGYLVATSYISERPLLEPAADARRRAFYAALAREATLVAAFHPHRGESPPAFVYDQIFGPLTELERLERAGPTILVYRLTGSPPAASQTTTSGASGAISRSTDDATCCWKGTYAVNR